jgi:hypothetical protein
VEKVVGRSREVVNDFFFSAFVLLSFYFSSVSLLLPFLCAEIVRGAEMEVHSLSPMK